MSKNEISKSGTDEKGHGKDKEKSEKSESKSKKKQPEIMMSDLLSAISETEYPEYIIEAVNTVSSWMNDAINKPDEPAVPDIFAEFFGYEFEDNTGGLDDLYKRLEDVIEDFADIIPNSKKSGGKSDTIIISLASPDYEGGLRAAIDHAAVFNRPNCRRVWIISDSFIFDDVVRFIPHVDALGAQGITLRFLLVTPWGWVEMPLSGAAVSKNQFLWQSELPAKKRKRKS